MSAWALACAQQPEPTPPPEQGRPELLAALREDQLRERHRADGGGTARLLSQEPDRLIAGGRGRFALELEVGPLGVADGGMVTLQISPFWGWSTPQNADPSRPGFTTVTLLPRALDPGGSTSAAGTARGDGPVDAAAGVELEVGTLDRQLLGIRPRGRALQAGERLHIVYGDGPQGATVDRYAEHRSTFWFGVDGDGDGVRGLLANPPAVDVFAGPAAALAVHLPSSAEPGETVTLRVAVIDALANHVESWSGDLELEDPAPLRGADTLSVLATDGGVSTMQLEASEEGIFRIEVRGPNGLTGTSNPLVVLAGSPTVVWADLHGHSGLSDGTGTPEDYYRYARDVAALDVAALTDHDHWGMMPLASTAAMWREIEQATDRFHDPGRFVTVLGYEWTNWVYGHRHVLYFDGQGDVLDSIAERYDDPAKLWQALAGRDALTFAHHSAGGPIATDWSFVPDPILEPVTEIASVHGSSEAPDSPSPIYDPEPGNFVRDVLDRGIRLGFVGSGDTHDGHPGLGHLASASGGVAAILTEELTRSAILEALRARRSYATNGPRIVLRTSLDGQRMGSTMALAAASDAQPASLRVVAVGTAPIHQVDIVRDGKLIETVRPEEITMLVDFERALEPLLTRGYLYVRVIQVDGGTAWSSPFFFGD